MTELELPPEAASEAPAEAVCVAVNIRPLVGNELVEGCKEVLRVTPGEPQVGCGAHMFTYDHVFGSRGEPTGALFERVVAPLVDGLFKGYNATVFAYGQTGSGKTYTMGSAFTPGGESRGVIPAVMDAIFARVATESRNVDFTVRVGFVEIHKEEIHDLLCTGRGPHPAVHIREAGGTVCLAGAAEREVHSREEMVEVLEHGTLLRATAATGMNKQSSRSHAIFTITLEQRRLVSAPAQSGDGGDDDEDDEEEEEAPGDGGDDNCYLCAKMHLVDLAGSERAKRTKAVGARLQEGININRGLLALGNVINALSEGKAHVPYRDSKLTRMLQDSLGGNSRTAMIACVSPADVNLEESLNTLRYANRARNIRNKPVVNRDPVAAQIAQLRQACAALRSENASLKARLGGGGGLGLLDFAGPGDEVLRGAVEDLEARNRKLQADNQRLQVELTTAQDDAREAAEKMIVAQLQRDRLRQRLQAADPAAAAQAVEEADAIASGTSSEGDVAKEQLERIAELEREVKRLKQVSRLSSAFAITRRQSMGSGAMPDLPLHDGSSHLEALELGGSDGAEGDGLGGEEHDVSALELQDEEFVTKEQAHTMEVAEYQSRLKQLMQQLQAKQAAMQSMTEHSALKQRYDERLLELRQHLQELEQERCELLHKLESLQHASEDERLRLKAQYEARIKALDGKVKAVAAKERRLVELEAMKRKADTACAKLQRDIQSIKQQKASLQRQMEKSSREFTDWKRQRDRELLQLKKQGRLNAAQLQKVEALHSKQQAVLRRKMEEAEAAKRKIKELEDRKSRLVSRPGTASAADKASAADRPFTAPAAAAAVGHSSGKPPLSSGSAAGAVERSSTSATAAAAAADSECQPNPMAPLLRDDKGRREWVEGELDAHCASFEYQKVMEGERAQRSEVQRKLREVEKALAALKAPDWWPGHITSPNSASEEKLLARKTMLLQQREELSQRFEQAQARLMEARAVEDAKGGVPADARRWNGVRSVVQARALLKTIFRAASQHKAEAMEVHAQLADLNDEIELLKLRLDIAEQEKCEAEQRVAEAEVLLKQATERAAGAADAAATTPAKQLLQAQPGAGDVPADEGLAEAHEILQQLNVLAGEGQLTGGEAAPGADDEASSAEEDEEEADEEGDSWDDEEEEEEEEEEEQSDDEERHALWDPSHATPARGLKGRWHAARAAAAAASSGAEGHQRQRRRSFSSAPLLPEEQPVLNHLNEQLRKAGKEPVARPTVPLMKAALKDKLINGQRWRAGSKKREELIRDYRLMLGLSPEVESPMAAAAAAAVAAVGCGAGGSSGAGHQAQLSARGDTTARSRILEHTASSLARCAATQPHRSTQQHAHQQTAAPAPVASARGGAFGSPMPPPAAARSRAGSASAEAHADASTTPVGAEGQQTPEAPELEAPPTCRHVSFSGPSADPAADSVSNRQRNVQLQALRDQLSALELGMNPNAEPSAAAAAAAAASAATAAAGTAAPPAASPGPRGRSRSDIVAGGAASQQGSQQGSPRRWWQRSGRPDTAPASGVGRPPQLQTGRSLSPGDDQPSSPALLYAQRAEQCKQDAVQASQQIDAALQRSSSGSPGRLARLFGRGGSPGKGKQAASAAAGAAGQEATYDLQVQSKVAGAPPAATAANLLRSSNSASDGGSGACAAAAGGGSRSGSPCASRDFRISSFSPENRSGAGSPVAQGALGSAGGSGGGGRPRSAQGQASRPQTSHSPRRQVWKPL
ncbi:hypothetical protein ABPG75_001806 [Micractinium tetrahymenae]